MKNVKIIRHKGDGCMLSALDLSKYIITKCMNYRKPISNLQLQKILYYIQVEFLKTKGVPAFSDEIEAWQFGPVVRAVYQQYCGAGSFPLRFVYEKNIADAVRKGNHRCYCCG